MVEELFSSFQANQNLYIKSLLETIQMVSISLVLAVLLGFFAGILLVVTREGGLLPRKKVFNGLNLVVNTLRSMPFIILMVAIMPFTKAVAGTSIGVKGAIVPLVVFVFPFISRLVESALLEVNPGVVEAFRAMGASPAQIVFSVLLKEALPGLVLGLTLAAINLIGATAMAGVVGAGGLGDLALRYGYMRWDGSIIVGCVMLIWVMVQGVQCSGNYLSRLLRHR